MFGGDRVELTKMVYRNSIPIPFLLSSYLFGESFEKVAKLTVKKTAHSRLINIWSNERAMSLFMIKDLNAFRFWKKDKEFMGCGKNFIYMIDPPPKGNVQGFVLGEDNDGRLLVETRNNFRLVVSPPTLEKYIDGNNKERFKWIWKQEVYENRTFQVKEHHPIIMNITKYNNLTYLTYVTHRCVYKKSPLGELQMEKSLCT